jgi:uncharacterized protein (DUF2141 family)
VSSERPRARVKLLSGGRVVAAVPVLAHLAAMVIVVLGGGAALIGCARQGFPEGGPRDLDPPRVIATQPDSAATGVPLDADVAITFSESMDRASVLDWILISPPREFGERSWDGTTFRLQGGEDFVPDVTTTVVVGIGCVDERERNPMVAPHLFVFSTGDSLDAGRIAGRLLAGDTPAHGAIVWALDTEVAAARTDTLLPDYITQAGADSTFLFIGLKAGRRYRVLAHGDVNRDREFDRGVDFIAAYPGIVELDPRSPQASGVTIEFQDPRRPGTIAGTVRDTLLTAQPPADTARGTVPDTAVSAIADTAVGAPADTARGPLFLVQAWLLLIEEDSLSAHWSVAPEALDPTAALPADSAAADTTGAASTAEADSTGHYELRNLRAGRYRVEAFLDQNRDQRYDAAEPAATPIDSVRVRSGKRTERIDLVVPRR